MELMEPIIDNIYNRLSNNERVREAVRGILLDEQNNLFLVHIKCNDLFGSRDHYELPGGGVEENEQFYDTFIREMIEETGYTSQPLTYLGNIKIEYNLLNRWDNQNYVLGRVLAYVGDNLTKYEQEVFSEIVKVNINEIDEFYKLNSQSENSIGYNIHKRDLCAIHKAIEYLNANNLK